MNRIFLQLSFAALLLSAHDLAHAATLDVLLRQADQTPVSDAVVTLQGPVGAPVGTLKANMDQRGQKFAPHVLAVHTGTQVRFPNSDNIRHQVYSFSAAKRFELRLYEGTPTDPLLFDKPGVVVLGCNIHDWMLGYIYVTDDPRFGVSDAQGHVRLDDLPAGARLLCTLLFGGPGAIGLLIIGWIACYWYYFPGDALRATMGAGAGAIGPYLVYVLARRRWGLHASLASLTPARLLWCTFGCALASPLLHHLWFALHGDPHLADGFAVMFIGDLAGSLLVVYGAKIALAWFPAPALPR